MEAALDKNFMLVLDTESGCARLKHSVIFSDGIIPFCLNEEVADILDRNPTLLPTFLLEKRGIRRRYQVKPDTVDLLMAARSVTNSVLGWRYDHDHGPGALVDFWSFLSRMFLEYKLPRNTPILCSPLDGYASAVIPQLVSIESYSQHDFNGIELGGIQMIDTAKLTWETVLAMREDPDLESKLRNFYFFTMQTILIEVRNILKLI